ncbi:MULTISPECIES: hypothetical protein [unclassified Mesorhizobium]|uniref:hypothetical protein n=1 Tax=unclassified Mesorhizobium TaxID=325217 RepID=UPI00112B535A|nr:MULTISPECIES: hypothetical protein [unclassified Mesorhizobium]TPJ84292.1 hypothetical protein FJ489_33005 [Mesorhizobium sp. B2-5-12]TPK23746.1 hypothetical protein FJ562_19980 [Mesorhizobium sp. B2-5-6]
MALNALLCFALLCFALLCFALLCFALLCFAWLGFGFGGRIVFGFAGFVFDLGRRLWVFAGP